MNDDKDAVKTEIKVDQIKKIPSSIIIYSKLLDYDIQHHPNSTPASIRKKVASQKLKEHVCRIQKESFMHKRVSNGANLKGHWKQGSKSETVWQRNAELCS